MKFSPVFTALMCAAVALIGLSSLASAQDERRGGGGFRGGPGGGFRGGPGGGAPGGGGFRGGPGGGFGQGGAPELGLLRIEEVREELGISDLQEEALKKVAENARPERPEGNFREMSEEERREFADKMRKKMEEQMEMAKGQLQEVLTPKQFDRLEQIALQVRGAQALMDPKVAEKLGLSSSLQEKMKTTMETARSEMGAKMREVFTSGDREGMREKLMEARQESEEKVLALLSSDQKAKFEDMKGEPFEMPEQRGGIGGRGGFGGGDDRGGRGGRGGDDRGGRGGPDRRGGRPSAE